MLKANKQDFLREYKHLKTTHGPNEEELSYLVNTKTLMENLIRTGYLDQNGKPLVKK